MHMYLSGEFSLCRVLYLLLSGEFIDFVLTVVARKMEYVRGACCTYVWYDQSIIMSSHH